MGFGEMNPPGTIQRASRSKGVKGSVAPAASFVARVQSLALTIALVVVTLGVGWMVWSVLEWRHGRTASYRLTGLRVVRRSTGTPIGLGRSLVRNALCCTLLLIPVIIVCVFVGFAFVMGASPPNGLLRRPRAAPWDLLTDTEVLNEHGQSPPEKKMRLVRWHQHVPMSVN
jgi:hypothetical protein